MTCYPFGSRKKQPDEKVPVACVWCQTDDVFRGMFHGDVFRPSHLFIEHPSAKSSQHSSCLSLLDVCNMVDHFRDGSVELFYQMPVVAFGIDARFGMRDSANKIALNSDDGCQ